AEARFDTRPGRARAEMSATLDHLRLAALDGTLQEASAKLGGKWDGRLARLEAEIRAGTAAPLTAMLNLPLRPRGMLPQIPRGGALDGRLAWSGEIGDIWALVPLPDQELTGRGEIDLKIAGSIAAPRLSGRLAVSGGRYQNLTAGTVLTGLTATSRVEPSGAFAVTLQAKDGSDGRIAGIARLTAAGRLEASLSARGAILVRRDDVTARISTDLTLAGPLDALRITGPVTIDRAEVRLVDASPPSILDIGPVRIKGQETPPEPPEPEGRIALDITLHAENGIFVRGRGLDSEWRADIKVGGTAASPRLTGVIEKLRGRFDLLGKSFDMVEGRLRFLGGARIDPLADAVLERTGNGITGRIELHGPVSDPKIRFSSLPAMPEDEVLPRLLFGTARQALTPAQALQLAAGINTLRSGDRGVLDTARDTLGVDVLQIDPGKTATAVTLGKTVAPGVFVGAKRELAEEGESSVTVEIEIFDNLRIEGEAGPDRSSLGIGWQKDF
ncbi:MAG: translocation/assembly module TamB, partial [Alphaproteobacteria bacterium]